MAFLPPAVPNLVLGGVILAAAATFAAHASRVQGGRPLALFLAAVGGNFVLVNAGLLSPGGDLGLLVPAYVLLAIDPVLLLAAAVAHAGVPRNAARALVGASAALAALFLAAVALDAGTATAFGTATAPRILLAFHLAGSYLAALAALGAAVPRARGDGVDARALFVALSAALAPRIGLLVADLGLLAGAEWTALEWTLLAFATWIAFAAVAGIALFAARSRPRDERDHLAGAVRASALLVALVVVAWSSPSLLTSAFGLPLGAGVDATYSLRWVIALAVLGATAFRASEPPARATRRLAAFTVGCGVAYVVVFLAIPFTWDPMPQPRLGAILVSVATVAPLALALRAALASRRRGPAESGTLVKGRYRLRRVLAAGAFGTVFLADDERDARRVVVKELAARWATRAEVVDAFAREAATLASVSDARVVRALDSFEEAGGRYLVLEHVEGGSLADALARGPLPFDRGLAVSLDLLAALSVVHARGVVHRDVKPDNLLLDSKGRLKLADFGVARAAGPSGLSTMGFQPGTLAYMAPEQLRGEAASVASDLYAAAAVIHETLAGAPYLPLARLSAEGARVAILEEGPRLAASLPEGVRDVLARALAKRPEDRWPSAEAMSRALADASRRAGSSLREEGRA